MSNCKFLKSLLFALLSYCVFFVSQLIGYLFYYLPINNDIISNLLVGITTLTFFLLCIKILVKKIFKESFSYFRITKIRIEPFWIIMGLLLPLLVSLSFLFFDGDLIINTKSTFEKIYITISTILLIGILPGIMEEFVFRGFFINVF